MTKQDIIKRIALLKKDYCDQMALHLKAYRNTNTYDEDAEVEWCLHLAYKEIYQDLYNLYEDIMNKG